MKNILYLASGSFARKKLLEEAQIPFEVITQNADETSCSLNQPLDMVVKKLAELKMAHVNLPRGLQGQKIYVLTADTLTLDCHGKLLGKPVDRDDAVKMLQNRNSVLVGTAFCLQTKEFRDGQWHTLQQIVDYDQAKCLVDVSDENIDLYLSTIPYLLVSGSVSIDGFGEQFVKEVTGCYSAIIGIPMYKLRKALHILEFFE